MEDELLSIAEGWKLKAVHCCLWVKSWSVEISGKVPFKGMYHLYVDSLLPEFPDGLVPVRLTYRVDEMYRQSWQLTGGDYVSGGRWQLLCVPDFLAVIPEGVSEAAFNVLLSLTPGMQPPKHMHPK